MRNRYIDENWGEIVLQGVRVGYVNALSPIKLYLNGIDEEVGVNTPFNSSRTKQYMLGVYPSGSSEYKILHSFDTKEQFVDYINSNIDIKRTLANPIFELLIEQDKLKDKVSDLEYRVDDMDSDSYAKGGMVKKSDYTMLGAGVLLGGLFAFFKK
jgi:hypothetical protein